MLPSSPLPTPVTALQVVRRNARLNSCCTEHFSTSFRALKTPNKLIPRAQTSQHTPSITMSRTIKCKNR
uniref:Uncharacterized protein n=1 Tax=Helianthus annuus TaxID=4232 RepID=A0A251SEE4_HELAN